MKRPLLLLLSCCCISLTVFAGPRKAPVPPVARSRAVIFTDSNQPASNRLTREINYQLYRSQTLARQLEVTLIDINPYGYSQSGAARYIKDTSGVWVAKYRPVTLPALFCIKGSRQRVYTLTTAEDIRKCL